MSFKSYLIAVREFDDPTTLRSASDIVTIGYAVTDPLSNLVFARQKGAERRFRFCGITDGQSVVVDLSTADDSLVIDETKVHPYHPMNRAGLLVHYDGRVFVGDELTKHKQCDRTLEMVERSAAAAYRVLLQKLEKF